ncbi:Rrf2 family transcriptional regulator [Pantoea dispersa]|jgi:DNA-binding IscR family transcriptional regulator|uniref:RrF2 family transcriptional regulator n=1 Tax=Pantoea dispersa TaxID=59814 RepID=UPI0021AFF54D|nr:Rrf2 family transcriptional regulator [Pantoea dispersa]MCT6592439.1 Rrf2 family transcriptional regulator [Pantoea dispersa]MCW0323595.1 putative HTH-type transcriptional regulator YwnA [Pantoea dispersa]MCW0328362.1 putative HTH-type transcriptional regulator YwnA [Pantoea dispersa]MCW0434787.1 putative HTH-type transcriptional regulator YwnA [Pantoea dispersa]
MPRDNRLSRSLHALIHLDRHVKRTTSDAMAKMLGTNPVVVRRMMSGLREKGYLVSEKGHGGGWELRADLRDITLLDVYQAIGSPALFSIGPAADPSPCLVEHAVDARLDQALGEAEALLLQRFSQITVADIADDYLQKMASLGLDPHTFPRCSD